MKKILFVALLLCNYAIAQIKTGEQVPDIEFKQLLNSSLKTAKLSQFKGKIVFIEFWATWCSPCVAAMPHLQELQKKYKNQLQVITVTAETDKRIELFLKTRPSNLIFAIDTSYSLAKLFPHATIPHSILIDADGKLIANTLPDEINEVVIEKLLRKQKVALKEKVDNMSTDFIKDYFFASDTVKSRLMIQPEIKGGPGMYIQHKSSLAFAGRRLTMINLTLESIYRLAYGDFAYGRVMDLTGNEEKNKKEMFCLDIITERKEDLLPTLKMELLKRFELQAKITSLLKPVYVLKIADINKVNKILLSDKSEKEGYGGGSGTFSGDAVVFADIAEYLESFGIVNLPVVDETNTNRKFNIQMVYQPEKPETLTKALADLGLKLEKSARKIEILTLYK